VQALEIGLRPEVELDAPLASVEREEARALALDEDRALPAVDVARTGPLDLQDDRAEVGEHLRAVRAGDVLGQVEHTDPLERRAHRATSTEASSRAKRRDKLPPWKMRSIFRG
jgi:hypothetical protein